MQKSEKERVVAELTERLRAVETLYVADYRGLTMTQIDGLRTELLKHGARFSVVKNTLTRRAAEAAGADALLALLEGPSAIAFLEADGDPVAAAKALSQAVRETRVLAIRGGVLEGRAVTSEDVEQLAKLPPADVLRGQVLAAIIAPLNAIVSLVSAPLRDLVGLVDARIEQLGGAAEAKPEPSVRDSGPGEGASAEPGGSPVDAATEEGAPDEPAAEGAPAAEAVAEPEAEASTEETETTEEE